MIDSNSNMGKLVLLGKQISNALFKIENEPLNFQRFEEVFKLRKEFDDLISKAFHAGEIDSPEKFNNYKLDDD